MECQCNRNIGPSTNFSTNQKIEEQLKIQSCFVIGWNISKQSKIPIALKVQLCECYPLHIWTQFLKVSSLKYRVWWTGSLSLFQTWTLQANSSILIFQTGDDFSFILCLLKTFIKCWNQTSFWEFSTIVSFWPRQMTGEARGNFNEFVAVPPIFWIHQSLFYLWIMWKVRNLLKNSFNSLTLYHTTCLWI